MQRPLPEHSPWIPQLPARSATTPRSSASSASRTPLRTSSSSSLPPLFPLLRAEFGVSYATLGALVSVFYAASGICQFGAGFAVDRFGARPVLLGGLALLAGGVLLAGLVPGFYWLFPLVVLMGIGNGVFHPADFAILNANVDVRRLGHAYSTHGIGGSLGYALAPVVSFGLGSVFGWRPALLILGAAGLVVMGLLATQRKAMTRVARTIAAAPRHTLANSIELFRQPRDPAVLRLFLRRDRGDDQHPDIHRHQPARRVRRAARASRHRR